MPTVLKIPKLQISSRFELGQSKKGSKNSFSDRAPLERCSRRYPMSRLNLAVLGRIGDNPQGKPTNGFDLGLTNSMKEQL